jgi:mannose/fructose/N-acetylgalactosamine-specific phosphotransferase system component IIC
MLACFICGVLAGDRTLGTVAGNCRDMFATTIQQNYATDKECADLIKTAMSTPGGAQCPGGQADVGTPVHKCMTKNDQVSRQAPLSWQQQWERRGDLGAVDRTQALIYHVAKMWVVGSTGGLGC